MASLACVELPELPLQILLRARPDWRGRPVVVLEADRPTARVLFAGEAARARGILPGQRYTEALARCAHLLAGVLDPEALQVHLAEIHEVLARHAPAVEPFEAHPGVFWLDARGLVPLYPGLEAWAETLREDLGARGLRARVVVGFGRVGSYALVRSARRPVWVLESREAEARALRAVPLDRLAIDPGAREALERLGLRTFGELLDLPPGGLRLRFGEALYRLHGLARETLPSLLVPHRLSSPLEVRLLFDEPERDRHRLLFRLKRALDDLLAGLTGRGESLASLGVRLMLDPLGRAGGPAGGPAEARLEVRPAEPTLDGPQVADLLRLRLERLDLRGGVLEASLEVEGARRRAEQGHLLALRPRRDLEAGAWALARVRAALGEASVGTMACLERHLPEATFTLRPGQTLRPARPRAGRPRLVRRLFVPARPWPGDGGEGRVVGGPHRISGGWWRRSVVRTYRFVEHPEGLLWIYRDEVRGRWRLQGRVD